jgi:hypothetical protein
MKTRTILEKSNGAMPRLGNNVHARHVRDRNPQKFAFAYAHECLMQSLAAISQTPNSNVSVLELP